MRLWMWISETGGNGYDDAESEGDIGIDVDVTVGFEVA